METRKEIRIGEIVVSVDMSDGTETITIMESRTAMSFEIDEADKLSEALSEAVFFANDYREQRRRQ